MVCSIRELFNRNCASSPRCNSGTITGSTRGYGRDGSDVDFTKLTSRDLKDLYLEKFEDEAKELYTKEEAKTLEDKELYQLQLSRITDNMLEQLTDHDK